MLPLFRSKTQQLLHLKQPPPKPKLKAKASLHPPPLLPLLPPQLLPPPRQDLFLVVLSTTSVSRVGVKLGLMSLRLLGNLGTLNTARLIGPTERQRLRPPPLLHRLLKRLPSLLSKPRSLLAMSLSLVSPISQSASVSSRENLAVEKPK